MLAGPLFCLNINYYIQLQKPPIPSNQKLQYLRGATGANIDMFMYLSAATIHVTGFESRSVNTRTAVNMADIAAHLGKCPRGDVSVRDERAVQ